MVDDELDNDLEPTPETIYPPRRVKPWEELGISPVEYANLMRATEADVTKATFEAEAKRRFSHESPGVFAGLGCGYWILIIAMCFFFGYLLTK
jgi:hypothetical protein